MSGIAVSCTRMDLHNLQFISHPYTGKVFEGAFVSMFNEELLTTMRASPAANQNGR